MSDKDNILKLMGDPVYRYENIYSIKDKSGTVVRFKPNAVQKDLIYNRHRRCVVPKARQHGITTCVAIHFLNEILFTKHQTAAIIAHRESDALKIFETKIKFVYDNMLPAARALAPKIVRQTTNLIEFDNGSKIFVDTMVRSTTLNYLHVSELGKMAAWYPIKAEEVKTGAFPAAERGEIFVESTMEGNAGLMAELCEHARNLQLAGIEPTSHDFKFYFYPWHANPEYKLKEYVQPTQAEAEYFQNLVINDKVNLSQEQRNWYIKTKNILGNKVKQEYPSTFDEAIEASVEGAFFAKEMVELRQGKRLCSVPYDAYARVYAALDLGYNDATAIVVFQRVGKEIHIIDHYEMTGESIAHYMQWLTSKPYTFDRIFLPHDAKATSLQTGRCLYDIVHEDYKFKVEILKRDQHEIFGIDLARKYFNRVWIDKEKCGRLVESLTLFSKEYNRRFEMWQTKSRHDQFSDSAKSFIYAMQGVDALENTALEDDFKDGELAAMKWRYRPVR